MKPLSKKTRFFSLAVLFIIFIVITPFLLASSFGYKFSNLDDVFTIIKTGGIYIHSDVINSNIYLDGEFVKSNGIFLRNTLIDNLEPEQKYQVSVEKEGFNSWSKELMVYPSIVSEARTLMIPTEIKKREILPYFDLNGLATTSSSTSSSTLSKSVKDSESEFSLNDEYKELVILFDGEATTTKEIEEIEETEVIKDSVVTTNEPVKEIPEYFKKLEITDPDLLENLITLNDEVAWIENGNIILNWIDENSSRPYYYCLNLESCRDQIILDWGNDILSFDFLPGRNDVFVVLVKNGLYAVEVDDRSQRNIQSLYPTEGVDFKISRNNRIIVREKEIFYELNL